MSGDSQADGFLFTPIYVTSEHRDVTSSTVQLGFNIDIQIGKLKLWGYVEVIYVDFIQKVPKNPMAGF